ncbi:hypothetical protein Nepgr_001932 [Nepenthes gracilis]|uniref:Secreted protein n=1 Tax=Nepenthes gracilis TaxID=150966 RepID=A0AAD3RXZ1_NEPGR|nr:hypothetical protein Nepgr_001932 [Nepenthes gracilis]
MPLPLLSSPALVFAAVLGWQWRLGCRSLCISIPTSLASHKLLSLCSARYDVAAFCSDSHISAESTDQKSEESRKQGYGRSLWLMHGTLKECGFVKKPDFLLKRGRAIKVSVFILRGRLKW